MQLLLLMSLLYHDCHEIVKGKLIFPERKMPGNAGHYMSVSEPDKIILYDYLEIIAYP